MAERRSFLLRIDGDVLDAVRRWADDDLRSLNGQVEFLLRRALRESGREAGRVTDAATNPGAPGEGLSSPGDLPQKPETKD
jgi:hypothetical protein